MEVRMFDEHCNDTPRTDVLEFQRICKIVLAECKKLGIKVQREDLDPVEMRAFLEKRQQFLDAYLKDATEKEAARMLRTNT